MNELFWKIKTSIAPPTSNKNYLQNYFGWDPKIIIGGDRSKTEFWLFWTNHVVSVFGLGGHGTTLIFFQITSMKNHSNWHTNLFLVFIWKVHMSECGDLGSGWSKIGLISHCWALLRVFLHDANAKSGCLVAKVHWATFSGPTWTFLTNFIPSTVMLPSVSFPTILSWSWVA